MELGARCGLMGVAGLKSNVSTHISQGRASIQQLEATHHQRRLVVAKIRSSPKALKALKALAIMGDTGGAGVMKKNPPLERGESMFMYKSNVVICLCTELFFTMLG
jgi:hypothetical protein